MNQALPDFFQGNAGVLASTRIRLDSRLRAPQKLLASQTGNNDQSILRIDLQQIDIFTEIRFHKFTCYGHNGTLHLACKGSSTETQKILNR